MGIFSFRGRMDRRTYLFHFLGYWAFIGITVLNLYLIRLFKPPDWLDVMAISALMAAAVMYAFGHLSIIVRRFHDFNRSGHFFWLLCIPIVDLYFYLLLFIQPGTEGKNRFDESDPEAIKLHSEDPIEQEANIEYPETKLAQTLPLPKSSLSPFYDYVMTFAVWWLVIWAALYGYREKEAADIAYQSTESGKRELAANYARQNIPILAKYKLKPDSLKATEKRLHFTQTLQFYGYGNNAESVTITIASEDTGREHLEKIADFYKDRYTGCKWLSMRFFADSIAPHTESEWFDRHTYFAQYLYQKDDAYNQNGLSYHWKRDEFELRQDSLSAIRHAVKR